MSSRPGGGRPLRVAVLGGDGRRASVTKACVAARFPGQKVRTRVYPSTGYVGRRGYTALLTSIKAGGVDHVFILAKWVGHAEAGMVVATCRTYGIPFVHITKEGTP